MRKYKKPAVTVTVLKSLRSAAQKAKNAEFGPRFTIRDRDESMGADAATSARQAVADLQHRMNGDIIGQERVVERIIVALLAGGNVLLEGLPGLAKTRAVKSLARHLDAEFRRIQFTPDLLPSDVTGGEILRGDGKFEFRKGPIFGNLVLADEINRAPAKVQSALLEAMEERHVTVCRHSATICQACSWSWRPKTRSNRKAPIPCRKRRWIGS